MSNVTDLSAIYTDNFTYCIPETVLRKFMEGDIFGRTEKYTDEEFARVVEDAQAIFDSVMESDPDEKRVCIITAGPPGAGKTVLLEQVLEEERSKGRVYGYTDPDAVALKSMHASWGRDLCEEGTLEQQQEARKNAYDKWRPASNFIAHRVLASLIKDGKAFAFGTTASSPQMAGNFEYFRKHGYKIRLLHVSAPDAVRWDSVRRRDLEFVQTTEEDIRNKRGLVVERISDTFMKSADELQFFFRDYPVGDTSQLRCEEESKNPSDVNDQARNDSQPADDSRYYKGTHSQEMGQALNVGESFERVQTNPSDCTENASRDRGDIDPHEQHQNDSYYSSGKASQSKLAFHEESSNTSCTTENRRKNDADADRNELEGEHMACADQLDLFYQGDVSQDATLAATWVRHQQSDFGTLNIVNKVAYNKITELHDEIIYDMKDAPESLLWKNSVERLSIEEN